MHNGWHSGSGRASWQFRLLNERTASHAEIQVLPRSNAGARPCSSDQIEGQTANMPPWYGRSAAASDERVDRVFGLKALWPGVPKLWHPDPRHRTTSICVQQSWGHLSSGGCGENPYSFRAVENRIANSEWRNQNPRFPFAVD